MQIDQYDAETAALIRTCLEQQKNMDPKVLKSLAQLKKIATKKNDAALLGFSYYYLANTYYLMETNFSNFRTCLVKAINALQHTNETALLARSYNYIGVDACNNGSYDVAYHYFMMALGVAEMLPETDSYLKGVINANLGQLYLKLGNLQLARQYMRLSIKQSRDKEDDAFFYHNLVSSYYLDGVISIRLGDLKSAQRAEKAIAQIEKQGVNTGITGVDIVTCFLRAELALTDGDRAQFDTLINRTVESLHSTHLIFDFMEDIEAFCLFLIEKKELDAVRRILDKISNGVTNSGVAQMIRIYTALEIDYCEAKGDDAQETVFLHRQHTLAKDAVSEQNNVYLFSIGMIDTLNEVRRSQMRRRDGDETLSVQILSDELTGLPSRVAFNRYAEDAWERIRTEGGSFGIGIFDLCTSSASQDAEESSAGDDTLKLLAHELQLIANHPDVYCARYEGGRFVAVFENMKDKDILKLARTLYKKLNGKVPFSFGVCNGAPRGRLKLTDYFLEASAALHGAKTTAGTDAEPFLLHHPPK